MNQSKRLYFQTIGWAFSGVSIAALFIGVTQNSMATTPDKVVAHQPVAVMELFTSEGCSSCPPADDAVADIARESRKSGVRVYPISLHVDYWNRLGWSDRFSESAFSDRQRDYARALGLTNVYTPQAVVNGRVEFVGSDRRKLSESIADALKVPAAAEVRESANLGKDGTHIEVHFDVSDAPPDSIINFVAIEREATTDVRAGENGGRTLHHTNIARAFKTVVLTSSACSGAETLQVQLGSNVNEMDIVAFIQNPRTMQIVGAEMTPLMVHQ